MKKKNMITIGLSFLGSIVLTITIYIFYEKIKAAVGTGDLVLGLFIALTLLLLFAGFLGWDKLMQKLGLD